MNKNEESNELINGSKEAEQTHRKRKLGNEPTLLKAQIC